MTEHAAHTACENCATVLQGHYCHVCGQRAHNPLRDFAHAVEEVFESLWHLDGRIFRTARELFVPGRVAANYLAGHRVRYIAPLRLFVILSLVTFFVGKLVLHIEPGTLKTSSGGERPQGIVIGDEPADASRYAKAGTAAEVLAIRDRALGDIAEARRNPDSRWIVGMIGGMAEREILEGAQQRLRELGADEAAIRAAGTPPPAAPAARPKASAAPPASAASAPAPSPPGEARRGIDPSLQAEGDGLLARWWNRRLERLRTNAEVIERDPDTFIRLFLGALPGALFLLVPLFALLLKLVYIRSGRGYLEHLVVALYSHALMLAALLLVFLAIALRTLVAASGGEALTGVFAALTFILLVPLYLLLMQKRVYAQGWPKTLAKYALIGAFYSVLLIFGLIYAIFAGLSS